MNTNRLRSLATGLALALCLPAALAQSVSDRPLRLIVPAPPGGTSDVLARMVGEGLAAALGQAVVVDNKPGAAGLIGVQELLRAPRDGQTLLVAPNGIVSELPHAIRMPMDPLKELRPVAELARSGLVFIAGSSLPVQTVRDAVAYAKANPGKTSYASYSPGSLSHTLGLELNRIAGLDMVHAGYRGSPPALTDVIGGSVQFMFDGPATSIPMVKAGRVRALATTAPKRLAILPDVPTFEELGYKDLTEVAWVGLWTTPDVPVAAQARLRAAVVKVLAQPGMRERLQGLGLDPADGATPDDLQRSLRAASERQAATLKAIGFKPD